MPAAKRAPRGKSAASAAAAEVVAPAKAPAGKAEGGTGGKDARRRPRREGCSSDTEVGDDDVDIAVDDDDEVIDR